MTFTIAHTQIIESSALNWIDLALTISDDGVPDTFIIAFIFSGGIPRFEPMIINVVSGTMRIPRALFPAVVSVIAAKSSEQKAYIALAVNLMSDVTIQLTAVDESGGPGGGSDGDYRLAGTVKINSVAVQRDLVVISDNPSGREIVGEGESAGDGTFDLTYSGWNGSVFLIALDQYGTDFTASTPLNSGTVIHPSTPNGYVYVATEAGITGATEPAWITTGSVVSGSVTFAPREYYRPVGWGPQKGALVE